MADCAAGPALFYADWVVPITHAHKHVRAYLERLMNRRPSPAPWRRRGPTEVSSHSRERTTSR
jgi:glutathione S-transferase